MKAILIVALAAGLPMVANASSMGRGSLKCPESQLSASTSVDGGTETIKDLPATTGVSKEALATNRADIPVVEVFYGADEADISFASPTATRTSPAELARRVNDADAATTSDDLIKASGYIFPVGGGGGGYIFSTSDGTSATVAADVSVSVTATPTMTSGDVSVPWSATTFTVTVAISGFPTSKPVTDVSVPWVPDSSTKSHYFSAITTDDEIPLPATPTMFYSVISETFGDITVPYTKASYTPSSANVSSSLEYGNASPLLTYGYVPTASTTISSKPTPTAPYGAFGGILLQQAGRSTYTTVFLTTGTITITKSISGHVETTTYVGEYSVVLESITELANDDPTTVTITQGTVVTQTDSPVPSTTGSAHDGISTHMPALTTPSESNLEHPSSTSEVLTSFETSTASQIESYSEPAAPGATQQGAASTLHKALRQAAVMLIVEAAFMFLVF